MPFAEELKAAAYERPMSENPFLAALSAGEAPRVAVAEYAAALWAMARTFPRYLAGLAPLCPDPESRFHVVQNLIEEEGWGIEPESGALTARPGRSHCALAARLAASCNCEELCPGRGRLTGRSARLEAALAAGDWAGGAGYLLVGGECNSSAAMPIAARALCAKYGLSAADVEFLDLHGAVDAEHGQQGIDLLARTCDTLASRASALAGVRAGARSFWHVHQACLRAARAAAYA